MTYQEIKDRLSKCEYTLKCMKDGTLKNKDPKTVNKLELLKESLENQLKEQEAGMVVTKDSQEAEKLAKKGVNVKLTTEGPHQTTYIKVSRKDYKKAIQVIDQNIDSEYVNTDIVDDDGDGNVIVYFNFTSATTDHDHYNPDSDPAEFIYDLSMDLEANGISVVDKSHDLDETKDLNDPVLMKLRALKTKIGRKKGIVKGGEKHSGKKRAILSKLQIKRDQIMRDMEQEAEPEGGPIADKYGDMLNKIDNAIAKAKGTKPKSYDDTFNEGQDDIFALGYDLDATQYLVDYLKSKYKEGQDYELHIGRGDTHPNAVTLINPEMEQDKELGNLLMNAGDQEETDYEVNRRDDNLQEEENVKLSKEHLSIIASKAGKAIVQAVHASGDEVSGAKIKKVFSSALSPSVPEAFTVHIVYKNDAEVSYRFQIEGNELIFLADGEDIVLSDVGVKPSGEPFINTELVKNEMTKYFKQMQEMNDKEYSDAKEADRLENHPEKDKIIAIQNLIAKEKGIKEDDIAEEYSKEKLLAYLGQADDAMIRTHDDKYLIIYNPKSGNQDNYDMWGDYSVFAVDQDGGEHEVLYSDIEDFQLEGMKEQALGFQHIKKLGDKAASNIDIETRRDSRYTFGKKPYEDDQLRYQIAKKLGYDVDSLLEENSEMDKIIQGRKFIKDLAPSMNKLPQDDPKRIKFIKKVKQINAKYKELLAKQDDKIAGTGRDQELDEGRGDFDDVLKAIQNMSNNDDISERDAAAEIVLALADKFQLPVDKNLEDYMEEGEGDLYEGTDLHIDKDFQFTRTNSGIQITEKYSGYGADARYIHVPGRLLKRFIAGLAKSSKVFKDTKYQGQDAENPLQEVKVGDVLTKDGKKGKVIKISDTQATVDFGNGDVYGIAHSRIKGSEIVKEAGPGFAHDCAAKVVHEKYGKGNCIPEKHTLVKEGEKHVVTHYDVLFESGKTVEDIPVSELEIKTSNEHWHKGYKKKKK